MKFGLPLPHFRRVASPDAIRQVALRAEQLGFDGIWVSDHIVIPSSTVDRFARGYGDSSGIGGGYRSQKDQDDREWIQRFAS